MPFAPGRSRSIPATTIGGSHGRSQRRSDAVHGVPPARRITLPQPPRPSWCPAAVRSLPRRRLRPTVFPSRPQRVSGGFRQLDPLTIRPALPQFLNRRAFGDLTDFSQQIIGQGHASQRRARLERAVKFIWHITDLDHRGHVLTMVTCASHVNQRSTPAEQSGEAGHALLTSSPCLCRDWSPGRARGCRVGSAIAAGRSFLMPAAGANSNSTPPG